MTLSTTAYRLQSLTTQQVLSRALDGLGFLGYIAPAYFSMINPNLTQIRIIQLFLTIIFFFFFFFFSGDSTNGI